MLGRTAPAEKLPPPPPLPRLRSRPGSSWPLSRSSPVEQGEPASQERTGGFRRLAAELTPWGSGESDQVCSSSGEARADIYDLVRREKLFVQRRGAHGYATCNEARRYGSV